MARVLDMHNDLAELALMRGSVNNEERAAGGVIEKHIGRGDVFSKILSHGDDFDISWLSHRAYFTTNPSLMRKEFMYLNPWPDYERECEGRFAFDLRDRGYCFGIVGNGEPWVTHIGVRNGKGY